MLCQCRTLPNFEILNGSDQEFSLGHMRIAFVPHNAYHTRTFLNVCKYLDKRDVVFLNVDRFHHEGVGETLKSTGYEIRPYSIWSIQKLKPDVIVVMNDWGGMPAHAVLEGKRRGIPTISHVEGAQDYLDTHLEHLKKGPKRNPYQHAEYVFLMGEYDRNFIKHAKTYVTGSPPFDELPKRKRSSFPQRITVGVNCNFSYGLYEEIANQWVRDVVGACQKLNFNYHISQHLADVTDLQGFQLYRGSMYDMINDSTVFVSRFSTGILESLIMGRPVIYHNPHGERQVTFQDPMGAFPITRTRSELETYLNEICRNPQEWLSRSREFLEYHVAYLDGSSSRTFAKRLLEVATIPRRRKRRLLPTTRHSLKRHVRMLLRSR